MLQATKEDLTQNQINLLVEESLEMEIRDEFDKRKKWMNYEIEDMCSSILINIKNKMTKISENDKNIVKDDIKKILDWLKEKSYEDREDVEYKDMIEKIKKKYTVLIIKGKNNDDEDNVKASANNVAATNIYDDDNNNEDKIKEDNEVMVALEEDELGFKGLTDPAKEELKTLRKSVSDLCYSILDLTSNENINISKEHIDELKNYIDDTLIWMHVHSKITKQEYIDKISEINKNCDHIFTYYSEKGTELFKEDKIDTILGNNNKRNELENLCYILKLMIEDNLFPIKSNFLNRLSNEIEITLDWICENDKKHEENKDENKNLFYEECDKKITYINDICNDLTTKMQGIHMSENVDIFGNNRIIIPEQNENDTDHENENKRGGVSIISIMQKKRNDIMDKMILEKGDD